MNKHTFYHNYNDFEINCSRNYNNVACILNNGKCLIIPGEILYFGDVIGGHGVQVHLEKIRCVQHLTFGFLRGVAILTLR